MLNKWTAMTLIIAGCFSTTAAYAEGWALGNTSGGTLASTGDVLDATGRVIGHLVVATPGSKVTTTAAVAPTNTTLMAEILRDVLIARRAELEKELAIAVEQKRISETQRAQLKAELDAALAADAAEKLQQSLSFDEALAFARRLDTVTAKVCAVSAIQVPPLLVGDPHSGPQRIVLSETIIGHLR